MPRYLTAYGLASAIVLLTGCGDTARLPFSATIGPKPQLAEEDKTIGSYKLNIKPENIRIVNVDDVFAK